MIQMQAGVSVSCVCFQCCSVRVDVHAEFQKLCVYNVLVQIQPVVFSLGTMEHYKASIVYHLIGACKRSMFVCQSQNIMVFVLVGLLSYGYIIIYCIDILQQYLTDTMSIINLGQVLGVRCNIIYSIWSLIDIYILIHHRNKLYVSMSHYIIIIYLLLLLSLGHLCHFLQDF